MRSFFALTLMVTVLGGSVAAQTTGVPGFNDYTINGLTSGSTSCTALTFVTPTPMNFLVTMNPGSAVFLLASSLPCWPGVTSPFICQGTSFDMIFTPSISIIPLATTVLSTGLVGAGVSIFVPSFPGPPIVFSTQCVILDPNCGGLPLFTQAYDVTII
ncbi:MAG: hypothetical protein KDB53_11390 [Planctomycetes bacterium]|nr:hypothetical protein [Planctomycetota bacterium]